MGLDGEWIYDEPAGAGAGAGDGNGGRKRREGLRAGGVSGFSVRGFSVRVAAAVAVLAAAAGVAAGVFLIKGAPTATAAQGARATPSASSSQVGSAGLPALPALSADGNGQLQMMLTGRVLAVSDRSITIGGNGPDVTAAITRSTKITGAVSRISAVKAGAEISAQITDTGGHLTATEIQDPAVTS